MSHGALTSVSEFATAVATSLGDEAISDEAFSGDDASGMLSGAAHLESEIPEMIPAQRSTASSALLGMGKGLIGVVTKPVGGALHLVSAASQSLMNSVAMSNQPISNPLPIGVPLPRRPSAAWCERALACEMQGPASGAQMPLGDRQDKAHYVCHVSALPVLGGGWEEAVAPHEILLSSSALYLLRELRVILALSMTHIERLEAPPPPPVHEASSSRRMLAVFIVPAEAARLGIPSCLQFVVRGNAAQAVCTCFELDRGSGA